MCELHLPAGPVQLYTATALSFCQQTSTSSFHFVVLSVPDLALYSTVPYSCHFEQISFVIASYIFLVECTLNLNPLKFCIQFSR